MFDVPQENEETPSPDPMKTPKILANKKNAPHKCEFTLPHDTSTNHQKKNKTETICKDSPDHFMDNYTAPNWIDRLSPRCIPLSSGFCDLVGLLATREVHPCRTEATCFVAPQIPHLRRNQSGKILKESKNHLEA